MDSDQEEVKTNQTKEYPTDATIQYMSDSLVDPPPLDSKEKDWFENILGTDTQNDSKQYMNK